MKREFVFVHPNPVEGTLDLDLDLETMKYDNSDCNVTVHAETITITCHSLVGLSELINLSMRKASEDSSGQFRKALSRAIVDFIG